MIGSSQARFMRRHCSANSVSVMTIRSGAPSTANDADESTDHADLVADILGDPRRYGIVDRAGMHARAAGKNGSELLTTLGPL